MTDLVRRLVLPIILTSLAMTVLILVSEKRSPWTMISLYWLFVVLKNGWDVIHECLQQKS